MAKELPFFKFEPSTWDTGSVQMCTREERSIFIDLCSMYWQRLGDLPYKLAVQKICGGNATALNSLCEADVIKIVGEHICIDFLNEQLSEFGNISQINSKNAREGWEKRRLDATVMRPHSDGNAIREEKRREEEKREEDKTDVPFLGSVLVSWNEWVQFRKEKKKTITPTTAKKQIQFLLGRPDSEIIAILNESIKNGWQGLFEINKAKNDNFGNHQKAIGKSVTKFSGDYTEPI